jgi:hypothetical protein
MKSELIEAVIKAKGLILRKEFNEENLSELDYAYQDRDTLLDELYGGTCRIPDWIELVNKGIKHTTARYERTGCHCLCENARDEAARLVEFLARILRYRQEISDWLDEVSTIVDELRRLEDKQCEETLRELRQAKGNVS